MEALARGAGFGLMASAAVVTFCAVLIAIIGIYYAISMVIDGITGSEADDESDDEDDNDQTGD